MGFFCWLSSTTAFTSITYYGWYLCAERFKWNFSIFIIDELMTIAGAVNRLHFYSVSSKWAFICILFLLSFVSMTLYQSKLLRLSSGPQTLCARLRPIVFDGGWICAINAGGFSIMCHTCCKCPKCQVSNRLFQCLQWQITGFLAQAKPISPYEWAPRLHWIVLWYARHLKCQYFHFLSIGFNGFFETW